MNKFIIFRKVLTLMGVLLLGFSLVPNLPTNANPRETSAGGDDWAVIDATSVDLTGRGFWVASTNGESGKWNWSVEVHITRDRGTYTSLFEKSTQIELGSSGIVFTRDLVGVVPEDVNRQKSQTWTGKVERNSDGKIRIYGKWSGAYDYKVPEGYNRDFMMTRTNL